VDPSRVSARGLGPDQPIASNADTNGRAQNRRVEVNLKPIPGQDYQQQGQ
jgi:outer membrane protein OmpA-like peptidoglycan-associated protein